MAAYPAPFGLLDPELLSPEDVQRLIQAQGAFDPRATIGDRLVPVRPGYETMGAGVGAGMPEQYLETYDMTPRDYALDAVSYMTGLLGGTNAEQQMRREQWNTALDFVPTPVTAYEGGAALASGRFGDAAFAAANFIPGAGPGAKAAGNVVEAVAPDTARAAVTDLKGAFAPAVAPVRGQTGLELETMQRLALSEADQEKLAALSQQYPSLQRSLRYLTPAEASILANGRGVEEFSRLLNVIPSAEQMASYAKMGTPKQGWYRASTQALMDVFGPDAPRFAALLAATSPQTSVESNLLNTLNIWKNWTAAGRPTDEASIRTIMGKSVQGKKGEDSVLGAWINNSVRALGAEDPLKTVLSGPKVDSFYRNLADDVYRVTNDAWIANATGINQDILRQSPTELQLAAGNPGYSPAYLAMNSRIREGGELVGMLPSEAQETIWSVAMPLMESQGRLGMPAREILQRGLLTADTIAGTPDFSTLLNNRSLPYAPILESARYGDQIAKLESHRFPSAIPELTAADQNNIEGLAARLEDLRDVRARESRAYVPGWSAERPTVMVFQQAEAIPGPSTGHAPGVAALPLSQRTNYTGRAMSPFVNDAGHDVIMDALFPGRTLATRPMTGLYTPPGGGAMQTNPGRAIGVELNTVGRRGAERLSAADDARLTASSILRSGLLAQDATPNVGQIIDAKGPNVTFPRDKKLTEPEILAARAAVSEPETAFVDFGGGFTIMPYGDGAGPVPMQEAVAVRGLLTPGTPTKTTDYRTTRSVGMENAAYPDISAQWAAGEGSGEVAQTMVGALNRLSKSDFKRLDSPALRSAASDLHALAEGQAKAGQRVRRDYINMLAIVRDEGLAGLRAAVGAKRFLPAIAAIGLAPYLLASQSPPEGN